MAGRRGRRKSKRGSGRRRAPPYQGDLAADLLARALATIERQGRAAVSVRNLSRALRVSPASLYHHYPDQHGFQAVVARAGFADLARSLSAARGQDGAPEAKLRAVAHAYLRFAARRPQLFRLMFDAELGAGEPRKLLGAAADAPVDVARELFATDFGLDRKRADRAAHLAWAALHGLAVLGSGVATGRSGARAADLAARVDFAARAVQAGLGVD